jgi:hypothetical protein
MKVNIEIGELILEGFDYHDQQRISRAIEQELARLVSDNGLPEGVGTRRAASNIGALSFNAPSDMNPRAIGRETARSIYRSLVTKTSR